MSDYLTLNYIKRRNVTLRGIVHVGGHYAEEAALYAEHGLAVLWFEGHPEFADQMLQNLKPYPRQSGYEALFSDTDDQEVSFYITADEFASSLLKPAYHQIQNPHAFLCGEVKLKTRRFDSWANASGLDLSVYNVLVLDVQGAELKVLAGMSDFKNCFDAIVTEYSTVEFYENGPRLSDLEGYLTNFRRVFPRRGAELVHGDALFIRKKG